MRPMAVMVLPIGVLLLINGLVNSPLSAERAGWTTQLGLIERGDTLLKTGKIDNNIVRIRRDAPACLQRVGQGQVCGSGWLAWSEIQGQVVLAFGG